MQPAAIVTTRTITRELCQDCVAGRCADGYAYDRKRGQSRAGSAAPYASIVTGYAPEWCLAHTPDLQGDENGAGVSESGVKRWDSNRSRVWGLARFSADVRLPLANLQIR